ncbi:MAG: polysaccharide deacetylase family protein [Myxococcales bacterium]|nr:polysaccharide deacetylase family protein [Myxococcales bacterium]
MAQVYPPLRNLAARSLYLSGTLDLWRSAATRLDAVIKRGRVARRLQRGTLVFMFHRLVEEPNPFRPGYPVDQFEFFCRHLAEHYEVLPLCELERRRVAHTPSGAVGISFDDGYADNYELAFPILRKYNLPATVFITTGCMEGKRLLWTSRLSWVVEHARAPEGRTVPVLGLELDLSSRDARARSNALLTERMKDITHVEREQIIDHLALELGVEDFSELHRTEMLTWEQLREMDRNGFQAGGHTVHHTILSRISPGLLLREVAECKEELEGYLDRRIETFAYPNGDPNDFTDEVVETVRRTGYRAAYTTVFGANGARQHPHQLRRVTVYGADQAEIALQIERFFYMV